MKCKTGLSDYKFGTKNNWRRRVWNEAARRLASSGVPARNAVAAYLPGPGDLDRPVAISKGFLDRNLWAIERHTATHNALRKDGKFSINLQLIEALAAFPKSVKINFLFADLCCGFSNEALRASFRGLVSGVMANGSVMCFNLQRGREAGKDIGQPGFFVDHVKRHGFATKSAAAQESKHRGAMLYDYTVITLCDFITRSPGNLYSDSEVINRIDLLMKPDFYSYQSESGIFMDSVVFKNPFGPETDRFKMFKTPKSRKFSAQKKSASAMAAIRSMRSTGSFPSRRP